MVNINKIFLMVQVYGPLATIAVNCILLFCCEIQGVYVDPL